MSAGVVPTLIGDLALLVLAYGGRTKEDLLAEAKDASTKDHLEKALLRPLLDPL